jgi:hypothetical protein
MTSRNPDRLSPASPPVEGSTPSASNVCRRIFLQAARISCPDRVGSETWLPRLVPEHVARLQQLIDDPDG